MRCRGAQPAACRPMREDQPPGLVTRPFGFVSSDPLRDQRAGRDHRQAIAGKGRNQSRSRKRLLGGGSCRTQRPRDSQNWQRATCLAKPFPARKCRKMIPANRQADLSRFPARRGGTESRPLRVTPGQAAETNPLRPIDVVPGALPLAPDAPIGRVAGSPYPRSDCVLVTRMVWRRPTLAPSPNPRDLPGRGGFLRSGRGYGSLAAAVP